MRSPAGAIVQAQGTALSWGDEALQANVRILNRQVTLSTFSRSSRKSPWSAPCGGRNPAEWHRGPHFCHLHHHIPVHFFFFLYKCSTGTVQKLYLAISCFWSYFTTQGSESLFIMEDTFHNLTTTSWNNNIETPINNKFKNNESTTNRLPN